MLSTAAALLLAVASSGTIQKAHFGTSPDGKAVDRYILTNARGSSAKILTWGGILAGLRVPDKNGKLGDVVLGFDAYAQYAKNPPYLGALVGRYANRIAKGKFTLDGKTYHLAVNNGPNSLHGGIKGFDKRVWKATPIGTPNGPSLKLQLHDPAGTEGYPGAVDVTVVYTLTNADVLRIEYTATSTAATPINLTSHTYFNLKDGGKTEIRDHLLHLYASNYTPPDATLIPTGQIAPVAGTPYDFTKIKQMGLDLDQVSGFDTNFVIDGGAGLKQAAGVVEPETGRTLQCWTTQPGVQFYTAYYLDGTLKGRDGAKYDRYHAFCLETQHYPDSPNHPSFPSSILRPGKPFHSVTEYRFGVVK